MIWICVPSKFICWNLTPKGIVFGEGAFGRWLRHEGEALINGISGVWLQNRPQRALLPLLPWEDTERSSMNWEAGPHQIENQTMLAPWSQTFSLWNCEKSASVVYKTHSLCYLHEQSKWTKTARIIPFLNRGFTENTWWVPGLPNKQLSIMWLLPPFHDLLQASPPGT